MKQHKNQHQPPSSDVHSLSTSFSHSKSPKKRHEQLDFKNIKTTQRLHILNMDFKKADKLEQSLQQIRRHRLQSQFQGISSKYSETLERVSVCRQRELQQLKNFLQSQFLKAKEFTLRLYQKVDSERQKSFKQTVSSIDQTKAKDQAQLKAVRLAQLRKQIHCCVASKEFLQAQEIKKELKRVEQQPLKSQSISNRAKVLKAKQQSLNKVNQFKERQMQFQKQLEQRQSRLRQQIQRRFKVIQQEVHQFFQAKLSKVQFLRK